MTGGRTRRRSVGMPVRPGGSYGRGFVGIFEIGEIEGEVIRAGIGEIFQSGEQIVGRSL